MHGTVPSSGTDGWSASSDGPDAGRPVPGGHLRVSDADREEVAGWLREAAGRGELTLHEAEERQGAAYAAVTRADLVPLTADLPARPVPPPAPPGLRDRVVADPVRSLIALAAVVLLIGTVAYVATGGHHGGFTLIWIPLVAFRLWGRGRHHHHRRDRRRGPLVP